MTSTSGPLVSAVLPVHNRPQWIGRAIESVLAQTYPLVELVVVNDGSTDETMASVEQFAPRVVCVRQEHRGAYAARNLGIRRASGDLVAFIDSDDRWYPDRLARQVRLFDRPEVGLVFGNGVIVDGDAQAAAPARSLLTLFDNTPPRRGRVSRHFAYGNFVPTSSVIVRRRCLEESGGFQEHPPLSADYAMWFRIARRYELDYVAEPVFEYTRHRGGISHDLVRSLHARIALFEAQQDASPDRETAEELRRLLFHLHLSLVLACARRERAGVLAAARGAVPGRDSGVSWREGLRWFSEFAGNHARVRVQRVLATSRARG